jgi:MFS family permease
MTLAILYFIITAIQFWASDYLKLVLMTEEHIVSIAFTFTCVSAPTLGIILGGCSLSKAGGPQTMKAIVICLFYSIGAMIFSLPIPLANDVYYFTGFRWFVLFFGGAMVPIITGIIITSVPHDVRSSGNSVSNFMSNLIGYLPAPFIYGFISKFSSETHPRLAMLITMNFSSVGLLFISLAVYFKYQQTKEKKVSLRRSHLSSDLGAHAAMIANLWGNKNIENQNDDAKVIDDVCKSINKDNSSFYLEENENESTQMKKNLLETKKETEKNLNDD